MIKTDVYNAIKKVVGDKSVTLLNPRNTDHGDYAVHIRSLGKDVKADDFTNELFSHVTQIGDFINFTIHPALLAEEVDNILQQKNEYGSIKQDNPKKIYLEFGQPNTHKLPHIGHLFSYIYGESLARLLTTTGNDVRRCNYQGDVGPHVAKCLYQLRSQKSEVRSLTTLEEKVQFLQECYQEGSRAYEEDPKAKNEIDTLNKRIFEKDPEIVDLWSETRSWSIEYYRKFEKKLDITYDKYYFESITGPIGKEIVQNHIGDVFEESDGAVVFRGEQFGLHTRVFITKVGNPTYEGKDVGLAFEKNKDWSFDKAIITTAVEQNEYWRVVKKAIECVLPELVNKIVQIGFGMVDLKMGKMSSRTGNIISAVDLIGLVEKEIKDISDNAVADRIAIAAIKYSFLKSEAKKNISFDLNESISTHGNSAPYLLYTFARCQSILKKVENVSSFKFQVSSFQTEELILLRTFFRFPEVVKDAAKNYAPHLLATYIFDLSQKFNTLYEKLPILKAEECDKQKRLLLVQSTAQIIKNGLFLLGIETIDTI